MVVDSNELSATDFHLEEVSPLQLDTVTPGDRRTRGWSVRKLKFRVWFFPVIVLFFSRKKNTRDRTVYHTCGTRVVSGEFTVRVVVGCVILGTEVESSWEEERRTRDETLEAQEVPTSG
jgi:hypothetical protein